MAVTRLDNHERGWGIVPFHCLPLRVAGRPVQFMAVGALAMKHRSSITASQQPFDDTASALVAYIQHNDFLLPAISAFSLQRSSSRAELRRN